MAIPNAPEIANPERLGQWGGVDNINLPIDVGWKNLTQAVNFYSDRNRHYISRPGQTRLLHQTIDAGWSDGEHALFLSGGVLYQLSSDSSITRIGTVPGSRLAAAYAGGYGYLHTDQFQGRFRAGIVQASVPLPDNVTVEVGAGALLAGKYLISATAVDTDLREGGAWPSIEVDVPDNSRITVTVTTAWPKAYVYVSGRNGRELYLYSTADKTAVLAQMPDTLSLNNLLKRLHHGIPPPADRMETHRGMMFYAIGSLLAFSDPFDYEQVDFQSNLIPFDSAITMLASVETGLFVSTQTDIRFIRTDEQSRISLDPRPYGFAAIAGSQAKLDLAKVGDGQSGRGVLFATVDGICLGSPDGSVSNLTRRKFQVDKASSATATVVGSQYVLTAFG